MPATLTAPRTGHLNVDLPDWAERWMQPGRYKSVRGGRGSGKALADDTPIATPEGWTTMGALRPGDLVFSPHGTPVRVTAVHPQGPRDAWTVTFRHGEPVVASGDHLWRVVDHLFRKRRNRRGVDYSGWLDDAPATTADLAERVRYGSRGDLSLSIPLTGPLQLPAADLTIPPYLLGLWLGDGSSDQGAITATDDDADHYREMLAPMGEHLGDSFPCRADRSAPTWLISGHHRTPRRRRDTLTARLRRAGLLHNKHIPAAYLRASPTQRLDLLAGLMDSDGTINATGGAASITTINHRLATAAMELLVTLGQRPTIQESRARLYGRDCGPVWHVAFRPFAGCATLPRKVQRIQPKRGQSNRDTQRMITAIEPTGVQEPMTCITVDAADGMFCAGRSMIATHNSHNVAQIAILRMANLLPAYRNDWHPVRIVSARAVKEQIKESVKQVVEHYINDMGLAAEFVIRNHWIEHRNGSVMLFPGIDRGLEAFLSKEAIDVLWVEQAESLTAEQMLIIRPTMRETGSELWFVWNPHRRSDWCWQRFVVNPEPSDLSVAANWRHNPWWNDVMEEERTRDLRDEPPEVYDWIWEGRPHDGDGATVVLPYVLLETCQRAWEHAPRTESLGWHHAGLDLAFGGADKCALVIRQGPVVHLVESWPGVVGDLTVAAQRAWDLCVPYDPARIYYDASAEARTSLLDAGFAGVRPVNFGGAVDGGEDYYERRRLNKDVFARRNIQLGTGLRLRANRTVRLLRGDDEIDPEQCLFISPDLPPRVLDEWAQPTRRYNVSTGKWELEKADVGERSPDTFDGLSLAFAADSDGRGLRAG